MTQPTIDGTGHGIPRTIFGSDGSNWYAILVDSDGHVKIDVVSTTLPTDAATQTTLALVKTAVEKIDDLQGALGSVATDILRVASKGGDKIFGFESVVADVVVTTISGAGGYIQSTVVPTGKVWLITTVMAKDKTSATTRMLFTSLRSGVEYDFYHQKKAFAADEDMCWEGQLYLGAADRVRVYFVGGLAGDNCLVTITGVQMNAP